MISKIDLAEAAGFNRAALFKNLNAVRPAIRTWEVSAQTSTGMNALAEEFSFKAQQKAQQRRKPSATASANLKH